jgi:predicted membrane-bound spermidine synthase
MKIPELSDKDVEVYYPLVVNKDSKPMAVIHNDKGQCVIADTRAYGETLFIDGMLQSSLSDEYIYHEMMVHSLFSHLSRRGVVLILGGAEGCIAREVLKWPDVEEVHQIDWNKDLVDFFKVKGQHWNDKSYEDIRLHVSHMDALEFLKQNHVRYDAIIVDLFDPSEDSMDFLKTILSYIPNSLYPGGGFIMNAGSIHPKSQKFAIELMNCAQENNICPYALHIEVPSFLGQWCLLMGFIEDEEEDKDKEYVDEINAVYNTLCNIQTKHFTMQEMFHAMHWSKEYRNFEHQN